MQIIIRGKIILLKMKEKIYCETIKYKLFIMESGNEI
jgi:hypothetical protein